jgi:hypothetical protein
MYPAYIGWHEGIFGKSLLEDGGGLSSNVGGDVALLAFISIVILVGALAHNVTHE